MPDLSGLWTAFVNNPLIQLSLRIAVLYVLALYLAMVFWTVRDAQQRTENQILPYLGGLMVVVLNLFGLFLYLVVAWWIFYRWRNQQPWTFFLFIFVLISPTILYLASIILFPPESAPNEFVDYKTHYYSNHRAFFVLFALFTPVDFLDTLLKGIPHFLALGPLYFISGGLFFAGLAMAAMTRNERYHQCYALIFLVQTIVISFTLFHTLI